MALFDYFKPRPVQPPPAQSPLAQPAGQIPITQIDLGKRYDIYCGVGHEDRVYDNVRFIAIRTFDRITEYSSGLIAGYFEIEAVDGTRMLISTYNIQLICEHGTQPAFRVLRTWGEHWEF